jgi:hypothetical protein
MNEPSAMSVSFGVAAAKELEFLGWRGPGHAVEIINKLSQWKLRFSVPVRNFNPRGGVDGVDYEPDEILTELAMAEKDLNELFLDTLKDVYYAEKQIYKSLPKMAKAANSDQLRANHLSMREAVKLLDQTLAEEKKTDETLSKLAIAAVNAEAA